MAKGWVRFNEYEDVLASTDLLAIITSKLKKRSAFWKWTILAAHNGAQGALVCAIKGSTGTNILEKRSAIAVLNYLEDDEGERPREHLASFVTLLKKGRKQYPNLGLTNEQMKNLCRLNSELRNNFAHFTPGGWGIEAAGLSAIIESALDLIEVAMKQHQVEIHMNGNMKRRLAGNLAAARKGLANLGRA